MFISPMAQIAPPVRDSDGKPLRKGFVPGEEKIQKELREMRHREVELKIQRQKSLQYDSINNLDPSFNRPEPYNSLEFEGNLRSAESIEGLVQSTVREVPEEPDQRPLKHRVGMWKQYIETPSIFPPDYSGCSIDVATLRYENERDKVTKDPQAKTLPFHEFTVPEIWTLETNLAARKAEAAYKATLEAKMKARRALIEEALALEVPVAGHSRNGNVDGQELELSPNFANGDIIMTPNGNGKEEGNVQGLQGAEAGSSRRQQRQQGDDRERRLQRAKHQRFRRRQEDDARIGKRGGIDYDEQILLLLRRLPERSKPFLYHFLVSML